MITPTYTFVSVSTARPGMLDELIRIVRRPNELMEQTLSGVIGTQVSVDRERNAVVLWATFDKKETLYDYLTTEEAKRAHGEGEDFSDIIESFQMFDLTPVVSQR